jgi:wyosine [tRNA(Phe)-imidazoG37] synthetase (radical SAM superfamily)
MANLLDVKKLAFGPVPSRRLGKSLGINNIPPKTCSYSCVYCQLGKTSKIIVNRQIFYNPHDILKEVGRKVDDATVKNERIDYLTFVSDGEPTLDINLGEEISILKKIGKPIAVITNASLLWLEDVKQDLLKADYISLKVDAASEDLWRRINRPQKDLRLNVVLKGIQDFVEVFKGTVVSETMLINGIDCTSEFERIAEFLTKLKKLNRAYVAVPTRPPTEKWVKPTKEEAVNVAFQIFSEKLGLDRVELLIGHAGNAFAFTGNVEEDLLSIMAVHPMHEEAVRELLRKADADWQIIEELLREGKLVEREFEGNKYYLRKLLSRRLKKY